MRKRMTVVMVVLVVLLLSPGMLFMSEHSFSLMMNRERNRALGEEGAIARAIVLEIGNGEYPVTQQAAQTAQKKYGSDSLAVILLYHGAPMAGAQVPEAAKPLVSAPVTRATLLDSSAKRLFTVHKLSDSVTLLLSSDVAPLYRLRTSLRLSTALLCLAGTAVAVVLSLILSGMITRPIRTLSGASKQLAEGNYNAVLPPASGDEVGALTAAFGQMKEAIREREDSLQEQNQRQRIFIDAIAHEMRTPLTVFVAGCQMLEQTALTAEQKRNILSSMSREAKRLSDMDERLMKLTKIRGGDIDRQRFSIKSMCGEAIGIFQDVALAGDDFTMRGDRELMIELVRNLTVNAQRANGQSPIRIDLQKDGFTVSDTGCGMTAEQIGRAFEPFYRADKARSRSTGGAGLGLTLSREIAKLHGGELSIESVVGEGTTVRFRLQAN